MRRRVRVRARLRLRLRLRLRVRVRLTLTLNRTLTLTRYNDEGDEVPQQLAPFSAVYEHGCGHLDSSTCLTDLHRACVRDGIDVRFNQRVAEVALA